MGEKRYWFEGVPEAERYWFVAPWPAPSGWQEEGSESELPGELGAELAEREQEIRGEVVFGLEPEKVREIRALQKRMDAIGYAPGFVSAASGEGFGDIVDRWVHDEGKEYVEAPVLFTTQEAAEKEASEINESTPEAYLDLVGRHGEDATNQAFDNYAPRRALWVDRETLLESLQEARFLCVMVDGRLKLREDFIEELQST
jgi:hypothetical protein